MPHDNSRSLPVLSNSGDLEADYSVVRPKQADNTMLSQNDEEMCVDMSGGATGSRHSSPLSVDCTQYDDVNERKVKRKQRNNKRKRRSTVLDKEGLKTGYVLHTTCYIILNSLKSFGHLFRLGLSFSE
jgi:D-alanyl-D-alanine dipeptidase